jgi:hypothetical protein
LVPTDETLPASREKGKFELTDDMVFPSLKCTKEKHVFRYGKSKLVPWKLVSKRSGFSS